MPTSRPFFAARLERGFNHRVEQLLRRLGWHEAVIAYAGYGNSDHIRVLGRVVLMSRRTPTYDNRIERKPERRGWRNFVTAACVSPKAHVVVNGQRTDLVADSQGYIDIRIPNHGLQPGWQEVTIGTDTAIPVQAPVQVIGDDVRFGLVSDVDDTVITTWLPRPMIAFWNSFVLEEEARQTVPGMAELFKEILADHPGAPLIMVSTGAWNTQPFLHRFLARHGFPRATMLLTDWGPTNTGFFRSGADHKRNSLRSLVRDFPRIRWLLVGDDGQLDPALYAEFAEYSPRHVVAIAIRQLSPTEQVLAHFTPTTRLDSDPTPEHPGTPEVRGGDGFALLQALREILPPETEEKERTAS